MIFEQVKKELSQNKRLREQGKQIVIPFQGFPTLSTVLPGIQRGRYYGVTAGPKVGKCFGKGTEIIMYDGSIKKVEEIKNEDLLLGPDSSERKVSGTTSGKELLYKITPDFGNSFICNESHILFLKKQTRTKKRVKPFNKYTYEEITITIKDYLKLTQKEKDKLFLVQSDEVMFQNNAQLAIDPYFAGLWIGDGNSEDIAITNVDKEIIVYLHHFAEKNNLKIKIKDNITYYLTSIPELRISVPTGEYFYVDSLEKASKAVNIKKEYISRAASNNKIYKGLNFKWITERGAFTKMFYNVFQKNKRNIPGIFLKSSLYDRKQLLAGIIDSDGHKIKNKLNSYEIVTKYKTLAEDICFLSRSLGLKAYIKSKTIKGIIYFRVFLRGDNLINIPIKIKRKQCNNKSKKEYTLKRFNIEEQGIGNYYGFTVDMDHLFLLKDFTIVHNTQVADALFLLEPTRFIMSTPDTNIKLKITYFSLEMSKEDKIKQLLVNKIYLDTKKVFSTEKISSMFEGYIMSNEEEKLVESYSDWFAQFEKIVTFVDHIRNPTGIYKYCREIARLNGKFYKENKLIEIPEKAEWSDSKYSYDEYKPDDSDFYHIIITDHASLLQPEKGGTLWDTIFKMSSDYNLRIRDTFKFIPVLVQQQTAGSEQQQFTVKGTSIVEKLKPSQDGLADCKLTARDFDCLIGLFNPIRYGLQTYEKWDITRWKDNYRELSIILNRRGQTNLVKDLYFNGAVNHFEEINFKPEDFGRNPELYKQYNIK